MTDLTVKYFNSGMTGAPQIANNWGDLVTMLDACLVNGFALKAIDTLTCADGVATASISAGHAYRPEQVVEIAFDGVQRSTRYPGGVALRFARVLRYRDDKTADQADTLAAVRALALDAD